MNKEEIEDLIARLKAEATYGRTERFNVLYISITKNLENCKEISKEEEKKYLNSAEEIIKEGYEKRIGRDLIKILDDNYSGEMGEPQPSFERIKYLSEKGKIIVQETLLGKLKQYVGTKIELEKMIRQSYKIADVYFEKDTRAHFPF
jgi:hypothetical protein